MSYLANRSRYLELLRRFVASDLNGGRLCAEYMRMWRADRDEELHKAEQWPRRYDLDLIAEQERGAVSIAEFSRRWTELWGYSGQEHFFAMADRVFAACDAYSDEPENEYEITEQQLRDEVEEGLQAFKLDEKNARC